MFALFDHRNYFPLLASVFLVATCAVVQLIEMTHELLFSLAYTVYFHTFEKKKGAIIVTARHSIVEKTVSARILR